MTKPSRRFLLSSTAMAAALLFGLWLHGHRSRPIPVTIRTVWMNRDRWEGRAIAVQGTMEVFSRGAPGRHYAIEEDGYRVGVLASDSGILDSFVGRKVGAEGIFGFSAAYGVYLRVSRLSLMEKPRAPAGGKGG